MTTLKQISHQRRVAQPATKQNRLRGTAVAASSAAVAGLLTALALPYGPITTAQVWIVLVSSLIIGLIAGLALRTSWAMLLAPLAYVLFSSWPGQTVWCLPRGHPSG
ncbi:MAG: hypothetical protein IPJ90_11870 [Anaerolineaceae bacterium]|nr:hypothetical protein [Anaerolineaceae bacterium]